VHWYVLPLVDRYSAIIRPFVEDGGVTGALVGAIVDEDQVEGLMHGQQAAQPVDPADPTTD
jgi:hypothetical protein